ncbi:MAG: Coenzyme F420 hydrogenase/dehydrogenase, beta subunit C-terminal domain [Methanobrevibacter sp.]|jgi:coenzyme F420 hydrogenase subunit beta|nr:Coenzyme F420 hydrogenase/dehydrogenase, beta subunit C-terminal domain [Candidatus Methanoflexus mossambicus]
MAIKNAAMVGTPCQILAATKINEYDDKTGGSPIDLKIGLFCMENFSYHYLKEFLLNDNIELKNVKEFRIENNRFKVFLNNGDLKEYSIPETESFKRKNCDVCLDFASDVSDISVGSVGSPKGYSTLILRSKKGADIIKGLKEEGYIEVTDIDEKLFGLLEKIAGGKKSKNLANIKEKESIARPVLYNRDITNEELEDLTENADFDLLKSDVISIGNCVLCGACEFVCPENIVEINSRKPVKKGKCPEGCNLCYISCPRTWTSRDILSNTLVDEPIGEYLKICSAKSLKGKGQDGGVVTAILLYLLDKEIVDDVFIVGEDNENPWKPIPKLTNDRNEVLSAAGTKYSTVPIAFKALKNI